MRHSDQARSRRALKRQHEAKRAICIQTPRRGGQHNRHTRPALAGRRPQPLLSSHFIPISAASPAPYMHAGD